MDVIQEMTVGELLQLITAATVGVSALIQFLPIPVHPWSWIASQVCKEINKEMVSDIKSLKNDIQEMKEDLLKLGCVVGEQGAKNSRSKILRFGDEILHGMEHSKEHFDEILQDITEYNTYCAEHPDFKNQMTVTTTKLIISQYEKCVREKSFL